MKIHLIAAVLLLSAVTPVCGATTNGVQFINDDFPKGMAEARQRNLPVFVEVWAPW
jgi:hypothetical protein